MKIFLLLILGIITLTSCTNKYENILKSNTAEVQEFLLEGKSNNIKSSLVCGMREKEYKINGYATDLIEFGILTFELPNIDDYDVSLAQYVLTVDTLRYDGELEKNPFNNTLVADIKKIINLSDNITAKLIIGDFVSEIKLNNVADEWKVNSDDVYQIVSNKFKPDIETLNSNNIFGGEVYVKIINDADMYKGDYYWYVSIIGRKGGTLSLIICPDSKDILAVNNTIKKVE